MNDPIILKCPHCKEFVMMNENELNCRIYRHGVFKETFQQIHPHSPKELCDEFIRKKLVYGCARPFKIVNDEKGKYKLEKCDYI